MAGSIRLIGLRLGENGKNGGPALDRRVELRLPTEKFGVRICDPP